MSCGQGAALKSVSTSFPWQYLLKFVNQHFKELELNGNDPKLLFKDGDNNTLDIFL